MRIVTKEDVVYLSKLGYSKKEIDQIKYAAIRTKYVHGSKLISATKAIEILGKEEFLSGLCRSAFHYTALREPLDKNDFNMVLFDSSEMFRME